MTTTCLPLTTELAKNFLFSAQGVNKRSEFKERKQDVKNSISIKKKLHLQNNFSNFG